MRPIEFLYKSLLLLFVLLVPMQLNCQDVAQNSTSVFEGTAPTIDGKIEQTEWQDATVFELTNGGRAYLKYDVQCLYIGVRGVKAGWGHLYLNDGVSTDVSVIHASAALGKSVYKLDQKKLWQPSNQFKWEMRDNTITAETRRRMDAYLMQNGWVSSNNNMGNSMEIEFAVSRQAFAGKSLRLAIVYVADGTESQFFPATLADDTLKPRLLSGNTPPDLKFNTDQWAQVTFLRKQQGN